MDIIRKQPLFIFSVGSIGVLTVLMGVAIARLQSWQVVDAQEDIVAADGSFACEPLVFTLSANDEVTASGSPIAQASVTPTPTGTAKASGTASPTATGTAKASGSATPTSSSIAQGGVTTTPTATAKPSSTGTATAKPTSTAVASLPDAGISTPTMIGLAAGFLLLLAAALLAL